jgi:hypothetical protein
MNWKNQLSKKPYLIMLVLLIGIGSGTAYAGVVLPTITLGGNVEVIGNLNCPNCIIGFYEASSSFKGNTADVILLADCDGGDEAISGGFSVDSLVNSAPPERSLKFDFDSWIVAWDENNNQITYTAYAYCADYAPAHIEV